MERICPQCKHPTDHINDLFGFCKTCRIYITNNKKVLESVMNAEYDRLLFYTVN